MQICHKLSTVLSTRVRITPDAGLWEILRSNNVHRSPCTHTGTSHLWKPWEGKPRLNSFQIRWSVWDAIMHIGARDWKHLPADKMCITNLLVLLSRMPGMQIWDWSDIVKECNCFVFSVQICWEKSFLNGPKRKKEKNKKKIETKTDY